MLKEIIILVTIMISIVLVDYVTQDYTKESVQEIITRLSELEENVKSENNNFNENVKQILETWEQKTEKLAYFIEHDELEKIETNLTNIKSFVEEKQFEWAFNSIDETKFILNHIKEKNAFNLENIF